jgi:hypothetical protein
MKPQQYAAVMFLLMFHQSVYSQEGSSPDSLLSGRKALTFTFSAFSLGGGLGGKYWLDDSRFLTLTLTGSFARSIDERPLTTSNSYRYNSSSYRFGISVGIAQRFLENRVLSPYAGIAARVDRSWSKTERVYADRTEIDRYTSTAFGGRVLIGVEYWFVDNISLSGEQSVSLAYTIYRGSKVFEIQNATSSLLLSVYF